MKRDTVCKYCKKAFSSEKVLTGHMCVKKKRYIDKDSMPSRLGFRVFQKFYKVTTNAKKEKTVDDFIENRFYKSFIKFGRYLIDIQPPNIDHFVDFVITNGVKMNDWTSPAIYDAYIIDWTRKEPVDKAIERTINTISEWCSENNKDIPDFFNSVSPNYAAMLIKNGKISPWVIYLSSSAENLLSKMNEEHVKMIKDVIEPAYWNKTFKKNSDDTKIVSEVLEYANL